MRALSIPFLVAMLVLSSPVAIQAEENRPATREWVDAKGRKIQARLITVEGTNAVLELKNGKRFRFHLEKLSKKDNEFIKEWQRNPTFDSGLLKELMSWPTEVTVDHQVKIKPVKEDESKRQYVYQSEHFEFHLDFKLDRVLIRDWAKVFEATFKTVSEIPWNINPEAPKDLFKCYIYADRAGYMRAGGPPSSAGAYNLRTRRIMIPAESFGIRKVRDEFKKDDSREYDLSTLIHEITHQVMHEWLPDIPMWLAEGAAEYMSTIPYRGGRFSVVNAKRGTREYLKNNLRYANIYGRYYKGKKKDDRAIDMIPLKELIPMTTQQFQARGRRLGQDEAIRAYYSSLMLTYYLMHIDKRGDGRGLISYIDKIGERHRVLAPYQKKIDAYTTALAEYQEKRDRGEDAQRPRPPGALPPHLRSYLDSEAWEKKCRQIFLQGRSIEELETELKAAYKKMGIKVK